MKRKSYRVVDAAGSYVDLQKVDGPQFPTCSFYKVDILPEQNYKILENIFDVLERNDRLTVTMPEHHVVGRAGRNVSNYEFMILAK
jgi:hypothetical protein